MKRSEIFVCLPNFSGGGAERVMTLVYHLLSSKSSYVPNKNLSDQKPPHDCINHSTQKQSFTNQKWGLLHVTKSDFIVTCVVLNDDGPLKSAVSESCEIVNLILSARSAIASLVKLFRQRKPKIVISTLAYFNFVIGWLCWSVVTSRSER